MRIITSSFVLFCLLFSISIAQTPLATKKIGGYSTEWEIKLIDYGKDNKVMIFDFLVTLKKGKEAIYGIGRGNKATRLMESDGSERNDTWIQLGAKKSSENVLQFSGTPTYISNMFSIDVPIKLQIRFDAVESDDFSLVGFYIADDTNYGASGGYKVEFKRAEIKR